MNTPPRPLHTPLTIRSGADRSKSPVVLKFYSSAVLQFYTFTDLQFTVLLFCSSSVLMFCSSTVLQFYSYAVLQFYSYAVLQFYSSVVLQFHTLTCKHGDTPPLPCKTQYAMYSKLYVFIFSSNMCVTSPVVHTKAVQCYSCLTEQITDKTLQADALVTLLQFGCMSPGIRH